MYCLFALLTRWFVLPLTAYMLGPDTCCVPRPRRALQAIVAFMYSACEKAHSDGLALQGEQGQFYVNATAKSGSKEISLEALQKRNMEINKYLVQGTRPHRLSLSRAGSTATESQMDDTSVAPTPRDLSPSPTPRTLSASAPHNLALDSSAASEASNSDLSYQRSPRAAGKPKGGFGFSDRPLLGGDSEDPLVRSRSFSGQDVRPKPSNLSVASGRDMADEESTQAMRRLAGCLACCCSTVLVAESMTQ